MIEIYPTKVEAYQDNDIEVFRLEAFDESTATLTVDSCINGDNWPEISKAIADALEIMRIGKTQEPQA